MEDAPKLKLGGVFILKPVDNELFVSDGAGVPNENPEAVADLFFSVLPDEPNWKTLDAGAPKLKPVLAGLSDPSKVGCVVFPKTDVIVDPNVKVGFCDVVLLFSVLLLKVKFPVDPNARPDGCDAAPEVWIEVSVLEPNTKFVVDPNDATGFCDAELGIWFGASLFTNPKLVGALSVEAVLADGWLPNWKFVFVGWDGWNTEKVDVLDDDVVAAEPKAKEIGTPLCDSILGVPKTNPPEEAEAGVVTLIPELAVCDVEEAAGVIWGLSRPLNVKPPDLDTWGMFDDAPKVNTGAGALEVGADEDGKNEKEVGVVVVTALPKTKEPVVATDETEVDTGTLLSSVLIITGWLSEAEQAVSVTLELAAVLKFELLQEKLKLGVVAVVKATEVVDALFFCELTFSPNLKRLTGDVKADTVCDSLTEGNTDDCFFTLVSLVTDRTGWVLKPKHAVTEGHGTSFSFEKETLGEWFFITLSGSFTSQLLSNLNELRISDVFLEGSNNDSFGFTKLSLTVPDILWSELTFECSDTDSFNSVDLFLTVSVTLFSWVILESSVTDCDSSFGTCLLRSKNLDSDFFFAASLIRSPTVICPLCVFSELHAISGNFVLDVTVVEWGEVSGKVLGVAEITGLKKVLVPDGASSLEPDVVMTFICDSLALTPNLKDEVVTVEDAVQT